MIRKTKETFSKNGGLKLAALFFIWAILVSHLTYVSAQTTDTVDSRKAALEAELAQIEKDIAAQKAILNEKQRESTSLERDIAILNAEIQKAKLSIKARNITIQNLTQDIGKKSQIIGDLSEKIEREKQSLAQLIRKTNEIDSASFVEVVLGNKDISEFFIDVDSFEAIKQALQDSSQVIKETRSLTEAEKDELARKRAEETDARVLIEAEKRSIERDESEKNDLLRLAKNEEKTYKQIVAEREKRAAQIRATLFALRDTAAIPFGEALDLATKASVKTGVRPAFILAILKQESNLGENVGTCNRPQDTRKWRDIMPGPEDKASGRSYRDDQTIYLKITQALGFDPDTMPLSCPWGNGWGGAMGPSQFIPTTWDSYSSRIASATGHSTPNPWLPEDAIMATALFLRDLGAARGGYSAEREAALRYYAGNNWKKPQNAFYGDGVMQKAQDIQENMINPLQKY